jgi:hypothetical protein
VAAGLEPGDLILINGYRADPIYLLMIGSSTETERGRRRITLSTVPADVFNAGTIGVTRLDVADSTTAAGPISGGLWSTTATAITVNVPGASWGTQTPYDVMISGERCTVTAAAAPSGGTQVLTVTRAVNGVAKQLPAGAEVHVVNPLRLV